VFVERAIEEYGSRAMGVAIVVDHVDPDLESGRASVFGLEVANPDGFEGPTALTFGEITIDVDLASLENPNPLVLDEIRIEAPFVHLELNRAGQSNLEVLRENATRRGTAASKRQKGDADPEPARLRIRKLVFADGRIEADTRAVGGSQVDASLATAELSDIGGARGATGAEIGAALVQALGRQSATAIGRGEIDRLLDGELGGNLGAMGAEATKGLLDRLPQE
jgi:uncharacterized protein involved in outer membrane biogenesis